MLNNKIDFIFYLLFFIVGVCMLITKINVRTIKNILKKDERFYRKDVYSLYSIYFLSKAYFKMPNLSKKEKRLLLLYVILMTISLICCIILIYMIFFTDW
jgi:hypothetical protein